MDQYKKLHHTRHGVDSIGQPIRIKDTDIYPLVYEDQATYTNGAMFSDGTPVGAMVQKLLSP